MTADTPARPDLRPVLRRRLGRVSKRLAWVRAAADHPDAVHDFRVACRELLASRPLVRSLGRPTRAWHKPLRRALRSLSALRDVQQMRERLDPASPMQPALARWQDKQQRRSRAKGLARLDARFAAALHRSAADLEAADPAALLQAWHHAWQRACAQLQRHVARVQDEDLRSLHRLRVSYKRWRYLLELLLESGVALPARPPALKAWQEALGEIQDASVMAKLAAKICGDTVAAEGFHRQAQAAAAKCVVRLPAFEAFVRKQQQAVDTVFNRLEGAGRP